MWRTSCPSRFVASLELAVRIERHANERANAWQERHIPERFWHCYHHQEIIYGDRFVRADAHARKADADGEGIRRLRMQEKSVRTRVFMNGSLLTRYDHPPNGRSPVTS